MKQYLLFDLDGTLTDPKIGITTCVQYALKAFGIEEPDLDKLEPFIGPPLKESFMEFYGMEDSQAEAAVAKYRERFKDVGLFENEVYKGIPTLLRTLQAKGMHLAVASSKPTVFVERILQHFHLDQYFEVVVGSELDGRRVNKDEVVQEALKRLFHNKTIQREQIYMIGDRKFDVEGARAHGIESVAVAYGYGGVEELMEAKADYVVCSVKELQELLLRDVKEEEYERQMKAPITQKIWAVAFPMLLFMAVRLLSLYILNIIVQGLGSVLNGAFSEGLLLRDEAGTIIGFTGNAATIMSALSYIIAGVVIGKKAKELIAKTADDVKLNHIKRVPVWHYIALFAAAAGAVVGLNLLFGLTGLVQQSEAYQAVAEAQYSASFVVGLICYGLITPIAEELLFRGTVYHYLRRFTKVGVAIAASALLFGLYHMNGVQGAYAFLVGCLMAYGYEYFGSFKIPLIIHVLANVLAYCLSYLPGEGGAFVSWTVCVVCLAVTVGCVLVLHRKKNIF
uniref:HAD hydrolase-like protein n=1 Tax=Acetatifactor sp. TaxID=1872090 RepID=UPI004055F68F